MADEGNSNIGVFNPSSSRFRQFCSTNPVHAAASLHRAISQHDLTRLGHMLEDNHIPAYESANENAETSTHIMNCCCGRPNCAYLEHNNAALGGLERDLETAARLGQALLDRHDAYVKESQAEQQRLSKYISDLENERTSLQDANHKMIVENRDLLQKLEHLNTAFGERGKRTQELDNLLHDCEQEIRRLNNLTRKTQELELKVLDLERERAEITKTTEDGKFEARSTLARWRESERKVRELEQEVQKIEWAARLDREKHEEIIARMEKDRSLERELGLSEGRLKATAAVQHMNNGAPQKQVVSNFVRDILQDNANLQAGIAELRDLLQSSNDEIQNLREQIMLHQPLLEDDDRPPQQRQSSLGDELAFSQSASSKPVQQEVHVHHHYHATLNPKKEKTPVRRMPRRRALMPSAASSSSPTSSGASTPLIRPQRHTSNPIVPLGIQPSSMKASRWSMQSSATGSTYLSSIPSSPRSYYDRNSSIFDRVEQEEESSRPTSPESFSLNSPMLLKRHHRPTDQTLGIFVEEPEQYLEFDPLEPLTTNAAELSDAVHEEERENSDVLPDLDLTPRPNMSSAPSTLLTPTRTVMSPDTIVFKPGPSLDTDKKYQPASSTAPTHMKDETPADLRQHEEPAVSDVKEHNPPAQHHPPMPEIRPSIRRSNSHDSLLSISGMDIHLAQNTHSSRSALRLLGTTFRSANKHHFAPTPGALRQPQTSSAQPLASVTEYTAVSRPGLDTASASMQALSGIRKETQQTQTQTNRGLIGSVGGWMTGKWGRTPTTMKSVTDLRSPARATTSVPSASSRPSVTSAHFNTSPVVIKSSGSSSLSANTGATSISVGSGGGQRSASAHSVETTQNTRPSATPTTPLAGSLTSTSFMGRPSGINQSGAIPGFALAVAAKRAPVVVTPKVDVSGLKESLAE